MKPGGFVMCISNVFQAWSPDGPKKGKVYQVESLSDACGCGHRIVLRDAPSSNNNPFDYLICNACHSATKIHHGGWAKKYFIDLNGDEEVIDEGTAEGVKKLVKEFGELWGSQPWPATTFPGKETA